MKRKILVSLFAVVAIALSNSALAYNYIWLEAETGAEYAPVLVKSDFDASNDIYLASWKSEGETDKYRSSANGSILFKVDAPTAGTYYLWARVQFPRSGFTPYDVALGDADIYTDSLWQTWAQDNRSQNILTNWNWSNSGLQLKLEAGENVIKFVPLGGGNSLKLDKILLSDNAAFEPVGEGDPEPVLGTANNYTSATVETYGQLKVVGTQLTAANNESVQLQGISTHGLQWFPLVDNQTIPNMAEFFGIEFVRLAMYIEDVSPTDPSDFWGGYIADPGKMKALARQAIDDAIQAGIYVIVDWHIHNNPSKFTETAKDFYQEISQDYGDYPNIIYEIANEPYQATSWENDIYPYATEVIDVIRANDPDNIIIVGTPEWSQRIDAPVNKSLPYDGIMYAFHYYAGTHDLNTMKARVSSAINAGIPVFVSEWGSSDVGTSNSNFDIATQWLQFMNSQNLSWSNWSLGNKDETSSILAPTATMSGPWTANDLSEAGSRLLPYFDAPSAPSSENKKPTVYDLSVTAATGQQITIALSGEDADGEIASYQINSSPQSGSVYISGSVAYYTSQAGFTGEDQFTYYATDDKSADSSPATVTITISEPTPEISPTPTPTTTPTPTSPPSATPTPDGETSLSCSITTEDVWEGGFVVAVEIKNTGNVAVDTWQVEIQHHGQEISATWSGEFAIEDAYIIATPAGYNGSLAPGNSTTIGIQGTFDSNIGYQKVTCSIIQ